jgi:glycosyltransferase involved in cell wall biosynthesis
MISAIVLTKNEEKNLERCLGSLRWCDELIVVDDYSSDKTIEIAKRYKTTVYSHKLNGSFSAQRNFGLSKAKNDWVLFIDADEIVSEALAFEISNAIQLKNQNLNNFNGFIMKRTDFMWGKQLKFGELKDIALLRLAKKDCGLWDGLTHEKWKIKGKSGYLINPLFHYPHQTLTEFLNEINFYTDIRAEELRKKGIKVSYLMILFFPLGKFLLNYFIKKGFMDGIQGLIFAITMSFHSFLVRGKLWLKNNE